MSRPALYVLFKNKEEIFIGVASQWVDETVALIREEMEKSDALEQRLMRAFELWMVRPFEMTMSSPEAKELMECSFDFAQDSLRRGYDLFESAILPVVALLAERLPRQAELAPRHIAHVLASAARGFKQTALKPAELRQLLEKLLILSFDLDSDVFRQHGKARPSE